MGKIWHASYCDVALQYLHYEYSDRSLHTVESAADPSQHFCPPTESVTYEFALAAYWQFALLALTGIGTARRQIHRHLNALGYQFCVIQIEIRR